MFFLFCLLGVRALGVLTKQPFSEKITCLVRVIEKKKNRLP